MPKPSSDDLSFEELFSRLENPKSQRKSTKMAERRNTRLTTIMDMRIIVAEHDRFFSKEDANKEIQLVFDRYDIPLSLKPEQEGKYLVTPCVIALPTRCISSKYR